MSRRVVALIALLMLLPATGQAQRQRPVEENITFGYAQVLRASPVYETVTIQDPEPREERRLAGYDVEYRYKGVTYMSRLGHDPGDRLRIRVAVTPVLPALGYR